MALLNRLKKKNIAEKWKSAFIEECNPSCTSRDSIKIYREWDDNEDPLFCLATLIILMAGKQSDIELIPSIIFYENSLKSSKFNSYDYSVELYDWYKHIVRDGFVRMGYSEEIISRFNKADSYFKL